MDNQKMLCSVCHQPVVAEYYFCPNCGNNLKETPKSISVMAQIGLYALAIFLPPWGLWPGIKYLMKKSSQAKWVGGVTLTLTILSTILTTWAIFALFDNYIGQMNSVLYGI